MFRILIATNDTPATVIDLNPPDTKIIRLDALPLFEASGLPRPGSQYDVACDCNKHQCCCGIELENWRNEQSLLKIRRHIQEYGNGETICGSAQ